MNLDELATVLEERLPTAEELLGFAASQGWSVKVDGQNASLRAMRGPLAITLARMLSREPWRSRVIEAVKNGKMPPPCKPLPTQDNVSEVGNRCHVDAPDWPEGDVALALVEVRINRALGPLVAGRSEAERVGRPAFASVLNVYLDLARRYRRERNDSLLQVLPAVEAQIRRSLHPPEPDRTEWWDEAEACSSAEAMT